MKVLKDHSKTLVPILTHLIDNAITFKVTYFRTVRKIGNLMRCARPYLDCITMISLYYALFYPHLIYDIEFYGHAATGYLDQIYMLQKSAIWVIYKIPPGVHMTSYKDFHIMPIKMLFNYRFSICFTKLLLDGDLDLQKTISCSKRQKDHVSTQENQQLQRG